jgi:hypothetical protein
MVPFSRSKRKSRLKAFTEEEYRKLVASLEGVAARRPAVLESRAISEVTAWKAATENWSHTRVDFVLATAECGVR